MAAPSELLKLQWKFTRLLGQLFSFVHQTQGWDLTLAEGKVAVERKVWLANTGVVMAQDRVHMLGSLHYEGVAQDLNLFVNGAFIQNGDHPAWLAIGAYWKSLDEDCAWGGDFLDANGKPGRDANHVSLRYGGKA